MILTVAARAPALIIDPIYGLPRVLGPVRVIDPVIDQPIATAMRNDWGRMTYMYC